MVIEGSLVWMSGKQASDRLKASPASPADINLTWIERERRLDHYANTLPASPHIEIVGLPSLRVFLHSVSAANIPLHR
jgi:hypothetical protein